MPGLARGWFAAPPVSWAEPGRCLQRALAVVGGTRSVQQPGGEDLVSDVAADRESGLVAELEMLTAEHARPARLRRRRREARIGPRLPAGRAVSGVREPDAVGTEEPGQRCCPCPAEGTMPGHVLGRAADATGSRGPGRIRRRQWVAI